jgi:membrane protein
VSAALTCDLRRGHPASVQSTLPPRAGVLDGARRVLVGLAAHGAFRSAAAVAFWFFLSLVPLLVLVGFLVGQVARRRGVDVLVEPLLQVVPSTAEDLVRDEVERLAGGGSSLAPLGVLGYLWSASSGVHNLLDVFDAAVQARPRPYWEKRVAALLWVLIGLAVACLVAWTLVRIDSALHPRALDRLGDALHAHLRSHPGVPAVRPVHTPRPMIEKVAGATVTLVAGTAFLALFNRFAVVHPAERRRRVWPGTFAAVACWLAVSWAFGVYAASIANYALFYGSLAAVAVLLIWLYLTCLCFVLGVEVNAMLERRRSR